MGRESEEIEILFRQIFDSASDGIIISDLESGKILVSNPMAAEMHGYDHNGFYGLPLTKLLH